MHQPIVEPQDRYTVPDDPGRESSFRGELFFLNGGRSYSQDPHIDERTALTYSAVWACKQFISQTIASLGWHVFERSIDGRSRKPIEDNIAWTLGLQANPEMNAFEWRQLMVNDALNGNGYSEIERTNSGAPNWMWRICPSRVSLLRDEYGRLLYAVSNQGKDHTYLTPDNIFHLRGPSPDGLVGYSVIEMFRRSIGLGVATERYGRTFYDRGPMPGGILKMPPMLKKEARDEARESFERAYGGSVNAGRIMVLTGAMDFTPLSLSNHDAQFILSRAENAYDVCRIYRVPPHKIGLLRESTNNNIEHQGIEATQDCILPWARRLEMEADIKLYGRVNRGRRYTRLNLATLLRGDTAAQTDAVTRRVAAGLNTINEGREYLDLDPIEGGDVLIVQGAMSTLDRIVNPPEPQPPKQGQGGSGETNGGDNGQKPEDEQDDGTDAMREAFVGLFAEAYGRQLKVEADKARRAESQGQLQSWVESFYGKDLEARVTASILPVVTALVAAVGGGKPERTASLAARLAEDHAWASFDSLKDDGVQATDGWQSKRAAEQAQRHVVMILEAIR